MKKITLLLLCLSIAVSLWAAPSDHLAAVMPLLQGQTRTTAQTKQVLDTFITSKEADTVFATGASLVRLPPSRAYEGRLLNLFIKDNNELKKVFAAVILTAMGTTHEELLPHLQEALTSADPALRAYAATAYTILKPEDNTYSAYVVNLYIYDPAFATRAMNLLAQTDKQTFQFLKQASESTDAQIRAAAATWLATLQTEQAAKQLLKMAKHETDATVISALAVALAQNRTWTLEELAKGLKTNYKADTATTYALALGFMPGYAIDTLKQALSSKHTNTRINAARATAYMAGVLNSDQVYHYSTDKTLDTSLLKGLIPLLMSLEQNGTPAEQEYAQTALKQIAKLK